MRCCSKCNILKPLDEFYTYYHSVQKKIRTRRICNSCLNIQKKAYKAKIRAKKENMIEEVVQEEIIQPEVSNAIPEGFKECPDCLEILPLDMYYKIGPYHKLNKRCKPCQLKINKVAQMAAYERRNAENGGSQRIKVKPDTYFDEYQKNQTFWLMELLGWTYTDGVWWKKGIKDKDKNWPLIKNKKPNVTKKKNPPIYKRNWIEKGAEFYELRKSGMVYEDIAKVMGCSKPTAIKIVNLYNEDNRKY